MKKQEILPHSIRLMIYEKMLILEKEEHRYLCFVLDDVLFQLINSFPSFTIEDFPELINQKPNSCGIWFTWDGGHEKRIEVIENAIKEVKKLLK